MKGGGEGRWRRRGAEEEGRREREAARWQGRRVGTEGKGKKRTERERLRRGGKRGERPEAAAAVSAFGNQKRTRASRGERSCLRIERQSLKIKRSRKRTGLPRRRNRTVRAAVFLPFPPLPLSSFSVRSPHRAGGLEHGGRDVGAFVAQCVFDLVDGRDDRGDGRLHAGEAVGHGCVRRGRERGEGKGTGRR